MATSPADALSIGEFTHRLKDIVEEAFPALWVRGEISNLRRQPSGHVYFTLKDSQSQLSAVLFRGAALRVSVPLRDGMQVVTAGSVSVYEPRGTYQLIVREIEEDGVGRLQQDFERLKQKLATEGLFGPELKRPIPKMPETVGVITSPSGAAIRDFIRILERRGWRGNLVVLPVRVQGREAAPEIAAMLKQANVLNVFDLLVVTRGGGSLEDLWPFNEELVVRAIRASTAPVISAVGHEIDFTLSDFAADLRAETPSGAAELISSNRIAVLEQLARLEREFFEHIQDWQRSSENALKLLDVRLSRFRPERVMEHFAIRLDDISSRLRTAPAVQFSRYRERFSELKSRLRQDALESHAKWLRLRLDSFAERAEKGVTGKVKRLQDHLQALDSRLRASGIDATLKRGFALVRDDTGGVVRSAEAVVSGKRLRLQFSDGEAGAVGEG